MSTQETRNEDFINSEYSDNPFKQSDHFHLQDDSIEEQRFSLPFFQTQTQSQSNSEKLEEEQLNTLLNIPTKDIDLRQESSLITNEPSNFYNNYQNDDAQLPTVDQESIELDLEEGNIKSDNQNPHPIEDKKEYQKEQQQVNIDWSQNQEWNYQYCQFNDIDFEKYEKENLEHLKKVYKPPQISDVVEKVEQEENGLKIQTISPFSIPKCNIIALDMSFLSEWEAKEITPGLIMYTLIENQPDLQMPQIDKKWCRDVQVVFEERDQNGELIDKYRVTKEKRTVKLQGDISIKWYVCLEQMKPNECKWFKMDQKFLKEIGQKNHNLEYLYLKIQILNVKALALSEMKGKVEMQNQQQNQQIIIYEDLPQLIKKSEDLNNEGKVFFKFMDYQKASKLFLKAYSIWRGITKKIRKTFNQEQEQNYVDKSNQYGANYAQCLINLKKFQECVDFLQQTKLNSSKNIYKLAKSFFELHEYEKAINTIDNFQQSRQDQSNSTLPTSFELPLEFQKIKVQCQVKLKQLEKESINTFYKKLFQ